MTGDTSGSDTNIDSVNAGKRCAVYMRAQGAQNININVKMNFDPYFITQ